MASALWFATSRSSGSDGVCGGSMALRAEEASLRPPSILCSHAFDQCLFQPSSENTTSKECEAKSSDRLGIYLLSPVLCSVFVSRQLPCASCSALYAPGTTVRAW